MTWQRELAWTQLELTYRASISHQLARYALAIRDEDIPSEVVHQAKRCMIDALGCAVGAYDAPGRAICEDTVAEIGGPPEATIFGSGVRTSALNASLVNSFLVRFLDFNDIGGGGHNSDAIASLLAVGERHHANGRSLLSSVIISYELGARFAEAIPRRIEEIGWTQDIRGGLTQPPALGRLMGLDESQIANAIGLCTSHALPLNTLDAHREENVMAKNLRFGWVAHDAILSCMLAKRGFTGPLRVVEGGDGLASVVLRNDIDFERLTDFSGWRIMNTWFKSFPTNATTAPHLQATLGLVLDNDLSPADIRAVRVKASERECLHVTTPSKKYPRNAESADHSAHYATAFAIKERSFGVNSTDPRQFTDPVILDLIERITVEADPELARYSGGCEITTIDGRRFESRVVAARGRLEDPFDDAAIEQKFRELTEPHLDKAAIDHLLDACWNLDSLVDLGDLTALMTARAT